MTRDAIMTELLEIEGLLQDDRFHLNAALALRIGVSHWMMVAGAVLVVLGFIGFAFSQNKNLEPINSRQK
jgi:hypothetical protein